MRLLAGVGLWGTFAWALAFGPSEALKYMPPELEPALAAASAAQQELAALQSGLAGSLATSYQEELTYAINLGFADPSASNITAAEKNAEDLSRQARQILRSGQYDALKAHGQLWQAQFDLASAGVAYERVRLAYVDMLRLTEIGAASNLQLEAKRLELQQAQLGLASAQAERSSAQSRAGRYGLAGTAQAKVINFALPAPNPETLPVYRQAHWRLRSSQDALTEAQDTLWPGIDLGVGYGGQDATVEAGLNGIASQGGPSPNAQITVGGNITLSEPGIAPAKGFGVTLGLALPLNPAARARVASQQANLESAQLGLERVQEDAGLDLTNALRAAHDAAASLELAHAQREVAQQQFAVAQARYAAGDISTDALLESYGQLFAQESSWAANWSSYLETIFSYLEYVDALWQPE